ncbi:MAG TPA: prepilin-type N-terminal cleavage/methylation domain-containing protein [Telluria sp.]|jgi:general secretion pathway protein J
MKRLHLHRGFTLIELLVAISILAIVAVLGWRGLDGIIRSRVALTEQIEATRGMQLAFAQLQSDAEHMANPAALQKRPFLLADADRMIMVRNVYRENEAATLQVVSYRVQEGVLTRRESPGTRDLIQLDVLWKAATSNTDSTPPVILQKGVTGMVVQTWENNRWQIGGKPRENNPSALELPPSGLQVALQVQGVNAVMIKSFLLGGL